MGRIDHPKYYKAGGIEAIDVIKDWKLDFCLGNAIKYIARAGKKSDDIKTDLEKAAWYIKHHAEGVKAGTISPIPLQKNTKYHAEDVCEAWGLFEDNLFIAVVNLYYGTVLQDVLDKDSMVYQKYLETAYYDLIRHIKFYV